MTIFPFIVILLVFIAFFKLSKGLYVLAAKDIFQLLKLSQYRHIKAYVSCFEIYGGKLFDLLNERGLVKCLEDAKQQVHINAIILFDAFFPLLAS